MNAASQPVVQRRLLAIAGVTALWLVVALPLLLGSYRCPIAMLTHHPCPGCGMTRAMMLLLAGDVRGSFAMHPLAVPTALANGAIAVGSLVAAYLYGAPWVMFERRWGKAILVALVVVFLLDFVLWIARTFGAFGGPVPV